VVDTIIPELAGGAHRHTAATIAATGEAIASALNDLKGLSREQIKAERQQKFLASGRNL
jgi:acetyl-CoA carboxylase carboxyl transferase subunit alpha